MKVRHIIVESNELLIPNFADNTEEVLLLQERAL